MSKQKIDPERIKETNQEMNEEIEKFLENDPTNSSRYLQSENTEHKIYLVDDKVVSKEEFIQIMLTDLYLNTNIINLREEINKYLYFNELYLTAFAEETETGESELEFDIAWKKSSHTYQTYKNISVGPLEVDDFDNKKEIITTVDCDGDINFENPSVESCGCIPEQTKVFPLKKYEVSYYIEINPLLPYGSGGIRWKKVSEIVEATRFRDAKDLVTQKLLKTPNKFKKMEVIEYFKEEVKGEVNEEAKEEALDEVIEK